MLRSPNTPEDLLYVLKKDRDAEVRHTAMFCLCNRELFRKGNPFDDAIVECIALASQDTDEKVRAAALKTYKKAVNKMNGLDFATFRAALGAKNAKLDGLYRRKSKKEPHS